MYTITSGQSVLLDPEDAHLLDGRSWSFANKGRKKYVCWSTTRQGKSLHFYLHRLVMGANTGQIVDHINGDTLDNRRCNLRFVDVSQNNQNIRRPKIDNRAGLLGAHWHKRSGRWQAKIRLNYKTIWLGVFDTPEEASEVYLKAKRELHPGCTI